MVDTPMEIPGLIAIDHVGIAVPDLESAITFYRDRLGMQVAHREINEEQGVAEAMMSLGDNAAMVQLLAPLTPDSPIAAFVSKRGAGLQQLAYRVVDVHVASEALRAQGMRLLYDQPKRGTWGTLINFVHPASTGGVLIELVQHQTH